jgi:hypothetical protein
LTTTQPHPDDRGQVRIRLAKGASLLIAVLATAPASSAPVGSPAQIAPTSPASESRSVLSSLRTAAPDLDPAVLALALEARDCAERRGIAPSTQRLAVIDYTRPSTDRRLWVFDLTRPRLLFAEHVAHGRGSGDNLANAFSNRDGSHQSSLGLFATAETYVGGNGYSLRMDGLEPSINDRARDRSIVMHGAWYVDPAIARRQGRLGRSYGCPAVRAEVARQVIDTLKQGQLLFAYYPDADWLARSRLLGCKGSNPSVSLPRTTPSR